MGNALRKTVVAPFPADRRHDPAVRRRLSAPGVRTFFQIAQMWGLSVQEQRGLLGWPPESTFHKYKSGQVGMLAYDTLIRISLVIGIYSALRILYPETAMSDGWLKLPNNHPIFGGKTALAHMIDGGMDGMYQVRRLLDSRRGM